MKKVTKLVWAVCLSFGMILSSFAMTGHVDSAVLPGTEALAAEPQPVPTWEWNPWVTYNGTTEYHSFAEMETELFWIADNYPDITRLESIGKSWQGRDIWAMKLSDNPDVEEDEPEIYFNGNHHAREWMTIEINLYFLRYMTHFYGTNATVTEIVDNRQIWVIPCANPDGRMYDSPGDDPTNHARQLYGWRKNARDNDNNGVFSEAADGVDLNRNYGYLWGAAGATSDPTNDVYGGPYPFSEPESAAIRDFARRHDFVFAISYHTYSQLILYPWGWSYEDPPDHHALVSVANAMAGVITNRAGSAHDGYIPMKSSGLYPTAGSDDDWLYGELGTFAYCIEAYPYYDWAGGGSENDPAIQSPYDLFHPRADKVVPVCQDNLPAMILMCQIADNRFQLIDHVTVSPETAEATIKRGNSGNVVLEVTDDGRRADSFTISGTTPTDWTVGISPGTMSLARNETRAATLSITVPAGATPGAYNIWVNVTSTTNASCRDSSLVTVIVPHPDDVAPITIEPFTELGDFPKGDYRIDSAIANVGEVAVPGFDAELTVYQLGVGSAVTVFQDDMDTDASKWVVIDHDTTYSNSVWHRQTTRRQGGTHAWYCGPVGATQYTDSTIQSLQMAQPISLERYNSATLQFYSYYATQQYYDFLLVEVSPDNGKSWDYITRYHGSAPSWQLRTLDLKDYLGAEEFKVRFRFTSDGGTVGTGFYLDTLTITADDPSRAIIYGPAPLPVGALAMGAQNELSWTYNFNTAGTYLAEVQTLHAADGNAANNIASVMFYINNSRTLPEFGGIGAVTNPAMGGTLEISWEPALQVNDPITYSVYRFDHEPSAAEIDATTPIWTGTATTFPDSSVATGQRYHYAVRAADALGQSEANTISTSGQAGISVERWGPDKALSDPSIEVMYMRGVAGEAVVNGLTTYLFGTAQSATQQGTARTQTGGTGQTVTWGMRAWTRTGAGVETELTGGSMAATVSRTANTAGIQSTTWNCPGGAIAATDSIVIRVYDQIGTGAVTQRAQFTTLQQGSTMLEASTWTVNYYTQRTSGGNGANAYTGSTFLWGTTTYNSRVENFQHSNLIESDPLDHNTVNWTAGGPDISRYNIYRSDSESGPWDRIATAMADTFTYLDPDRGQADATYWWYVVRGQDGYGIEEPNTNAVQEPGGGTLYPIELAGRTGWAFISYPVQVSGHIETVLNDTTNGDGLTHWDVAKTYDNAQKRWLTYRKGFGVNTFTQVDNTMGAWIYLTQNTGDQNLTLGATGDYPGAVNITLYAGWNMVGYPSGTPRNASEALTGTGAGMVSIYQPTSPYIQDRTDLNNVWMEHGSGYWVHVPADCVWEVQP